MTYPEAVFCKSKEYRAHEGERLDAVDLTNGELYSLMFALEQNEKKREAAKLPATVQQTVVESSGMYLVRLTLHDPDLKPTLETEGYFHDGFWVNVRDKMIIKEHKAVSTDEGYKPVSSYIMNYSDPMDDLLAVEANEELALTV